MFMQPQSPTAAEETARRADAEPERAATRRRAAAATEQIGAMFRPTGSARTRVQEQAPTRSAEHWCWLTKKSFQGLCTSSVCFPQASAMVQWRSGAAGFKPLTPSKVRLVGCAHAGSNTVLCRNAKPGKAPQVQPGRH